MLQFKLITSREEEATPRWAQISEGQGEGICSGLESLQQHHMRSWQVVSTRVRTLVGNVSRQVAAACGLMSSPPHWDTYSHPSRVL